MNEVYQVTEVADKTQAPRLPLLLHPGRLAAGLPARQCPRPGLPSVPWLARPVPDGDGSGSNHRVGHRQETEGNAAVRTAPQADPTREAAARPRKPTPWPTPSASSTPPRPRSSASGSRTCAGTRSSLSLAWIFNFFGIADLQHSRQLRPEERQGRGTFRRLLDADRHQRAGVLRLRLPRLARRQDRPQADHHRRLDPLRHLVHHHAQPLRRQTPS